MCKDVQNKVHVTNRTSESIELNLAQLSYIAEDPLCVQLQSIQGDKICKPAQNPVKIPGLQPSKNYTFSVFPYVVEMTNEMLHSELGCSFWKYTSKITQNPYK